MYAYLMRTGNLGLDDHDVDCAIIELVDHAWFGPDAADAAVDCPSGEIPVGAPFGVALNALRICPGKCPLKQ